MSAKLKPVPDPEPPQSRRIELGGKYAGQWVEYRITPTIEEFIAFYSGDSGRIYQAAADRVTDHSFGGDFIKQPLPVLLEVIKAWTKRDEEEALDPTPAVD